MPAGTVDTLLKPENKAMLTKILTYHVVAGRLSTSDIAKMIHEGGGKAELTTVEGGMLTATQKGHTVYITDAKGDTAAVTIANVYQSNGVIQVVNKVMLPG